MIAFLIAACALVVITVEGWTLIRARTQQPLLHARLDHLTSRLPIRPVAGTEPANRLDALAGKRAPDFALTELGGGRLMLADLLAPTKPLVLVFTDPRCGPCYELLPEIGGWQRVYADRLTIALVSAGDSATNRAMTAEYGIRPVLLQHELELVQTFELVQAPAAVVIQPGGQIAAGPRYGVHAIRQLVADTLGLVLPPSPVHETQIVGIGDAAPIFRRPDLDGNLVDWAAFRGAPTVLLFWSPGCEHCRALLPDLVAWERQPNRPRSVVVSRGPIGLNRELGLTSPVVLDDERSIARHFGVAGTPAAVLIDEFGNVAAPVVRGAAAVQTLLAHPSVPVSPITMSTTG